MHIASYIDHTILQQDTTPEAVERVCMEAVQEGFAAVCIPPYYVKKAKELIKGTNVKLATVIGFPMGYSDTAAKLAEIKAAIRDGADELDMVQNIAAFKNNDEAYLLQELRACLEEVHGSGKVLKLILETSLLSEAELIRCCELYGRTGVDFLKTSTGFSSGGADVQHVSVMRRHLPPRISIKASGGIRNFTFAKELIDAGAGRIGCSASMNILAEAKAIKAF